mmetsp:Transcript_43876/g.105879  ORF Transcript_43876/g.105879 Transcript_43876/m.105879 type:complete len:241 (+) Transcript_43876:526-1248(+)
MNANEVASHGERDGQRVSGDLVSSNVVELFGILGQSSAFKQNRDYLGVGLRLMVGKEDYIFSLLSLFQSLFHVVHSHNLGLFLVHQTAEEIISPFVEINGIAIFFFSISSQSFVGNWKDKLIRSHSELESILNTLQNSVHGLLWTALLVWILGIGHFMSGHIFLAKVQESWKHFRLGILQDCRDCSLGLQQGGVVFRREFGFFLGCGFGLSLRGESPGLHHIAMLNGGRGESTGCSCCTC